MVIYKDLVIYLAKANFLDINLNYGNFWLLKWKNLCGIRSADSDSPEAT